MTFVSANGLIFLPFSLNICALGDRVEPLVAHVEDADITITFPPSMTEGAVGKCIYPDGIAWWVVNRLYVQATAPLDEIGVDVTDTDTLRRVLLSSATVAVRRLLNAYRWRMHQAYVHPVALDPALFELELVNVDGTREALPEPVETFFFNRTPSAPPLDTAITATSLQKLQQDVLDGIEPPHSDLLALDIEWLESIGEHHRALELKDMCNPAE